MVLCLINHSFKYELEKLIRIFLPFEKIEFSDTEVKSERIAKTVLEKRENDTVLSSSLKLEGDKSFGSFAVLDNDNPDYQKECERLLAVSLYRCFIEASDYTPKWGILTGVRPAKLYSRLVRQMGKEKAEDWFKNYLFVNDQKVTLCKEAISGESKITALSRPNSFSLYISIPFCPSRCSYCSFVSHSVEQAKNLIPEYVRLLCEEIEATAEIARGLNLKLETVYIGGGTPTAISAEQLGLVMTAVKDNFDLTNIREYTVEAGRPDTVTKEKLKTIKSLGATRISINPQTMNNSVLNEIGRRHTAEDTVNAFIKARESGFNNINTDLIAGLPSDNFDSFKNTLEKVIELNPESITVHSLSMKRSSTLNVKGLFPEAEIGVEAGKMVDFAHSRLAENKFLPYYMYRQSKTVGNLENVGYSKEGYECLYNVYTMDETHTILACGASAVTKLREPNGSYIERIFNFKYPYEYISRFTEIKKRKDGILRFYESYPSNDK